MPIALAGVIVVWAAAAGRAAQGPSLVRIDTPEKAAAAQAEWAARLDKPAQWTNTVGMTFRLVPPGEFIMGAANGQADETPHVVRITQPFYLGATEVTRTQWEAVTGKQRSTFYPGAEMPINFITWYDTQEFINALNKRETAKYRLPTEAEWEYAARAGAATDFPTGDADSDLAQAGWYLKNSGGAPHPVAQKAANAFGLHDMLGNVWEWCEDFYDPAYYAIGPVEDPKGPDKSTYRYRVLRGGAFCFRAAFCRLSARNYYQDSRSEKHIGFRLALPISDAPPPPKAAP